MIKSVAHVCLRVQDLDTALDFYENKLGLERAFDFVNDKGKRFGVYLRVGERSFIELFEHQHTERDESQSRGRRH